MSQYTTFTSLTQGANLHSLPKPDVHAATTELDGDSKAPLCLILGRKGLAEIELRHVYTNDVVYTITDTGNGMVSGLLSRKPDFEITRPSAGNMLVGSIRLGTKNTETRLPLMNSKTKGEAENVRLQFVDEGKKEYRWKTVKSKRRVVKDRWLETNDNGLSELVTSEEVIVLELQDPTDSTADPLCVVRLYNAQPNGRFEIWTDKARAGDWHALDELVISAFANMQIAKTKLMAGLDPASFRFAAY